jgi:hypothetical protein
MLQLVTSAYSAAHKIIEMIESMTVLINGEF